VWPSYGDLDQVNRAGNAPWQLYPIGILEFSPLDNLAQYGWKKYMANRGSADGLGWPLHAIGDASEPHHVVGTTSWGHVPFEGAVNGDLETFFPSTDDERFAQLNRVIREGYPWWKMLQGIGSGDIRPFIEALAWETRARVQARGDWAYNDRASWLDLDGEPGVAEQQFWYYDNRVENLPKFLELLELSSGATAAFLTHAAARASKPGSGSFPCPNNTNFSIEQNTCVPGAPSGSCANSSCASIADCPVAPDTTYSCTNGCCKINVF
jgi:hypothetical protein